MNMLMFFVCMQAFFFSAVKVNEGGGAVGVWVVIFQMFIGDDIIIIIFSPGSPYHSTHLTITCPGHTHTHAHTHCSTF